LSAGSSSHLRAVALCVAVVAVAMLATAPASAFAITAKSVSGFFGSTGPGAGQMSNPRGVAVNQSSGNVYAVDGSNSRVVEFDSSGNFLRAFGQDVVSSGPDQANETQALTVAATSGSFTLSFGGATTANLSATATAAEVQAALNGLSTISAGAGSVAVSGGPGNASGSAPYLITFNGGPLAHANVEQITAANVSLAGGSPSSSVSTATQNEGAIGFEICAAGDTCKAGEFGSLGGALSNPQGIAINQETGNLYVSGSNLRVDEFSASGAFIAAFGKEVVASGPGKVSATSAVQTLTVTATGGNYTLSFGGKTTAELAFNASAATIQSALTGLTSIGAGNATVTETGAGVFKITFAGALANNPEPLITAASAPTPNELSGGTASVVNTTTGATGFSVCVAANGDVCKTGTSASAAGAFKSNFNGYPAVAPAGAPNAGDVLVADPANLRVQEFGPSGAFVRAFGFDVVSAGPDNKGTGFEVCSVAEGDACKIGITGAGSGQFANSVNRVAEDAAGDIYTVESTVNFRVQKFTLPGNVVTPQGNFSEANLKGAAASSAPNEVAIDPGTQDVLVVKAFLAGATPNCPETGAPSIAERRIVEVSAAGALEATHGACAGFAVNSPSIPLNGLAVRSSASTGDLYASFSATATSESKLVDLNAPLTPPSVGFSGVSGITAHAATVSGFVNPNGPAIPYGLPTGYHINYKRTSDPTFSHAPAVNIDLGKGTSNQLVSQQLIGLEAGTSYEAQIFAGRGFNSASAATSTFTFTTPASTPTMTTPTATTAATESAAQAALYGSVNPQSQASTYHFEYGKTTAYGTNVPVGEEAVGSGANAIPVTQVISGLQPETTYHFRVFAKNASGGAVSPDQTFTTPPLGSALPDNRHYEQVSPVDKRPVAAAEFAPSGGQTEFQASSGDNGIVYALKNGLPDATAGGDTRYLGERDPTGWQSTQLTPPALIPPVSGENVSTGAILISSANLACTLLESTEPLTADTPETDLENGTNNLYLRDNSTGTYTLLSYTEPLNPGISISEALYEIGGVTDDCKHILFETRYRLLPEATGANGVYEWSEGTLRLAGVLPDGSVPAAAEIGGQEEGEQIVFSTLSSDGARAIFTAQSNSGGDSGKKAIFVRKDGLTTVDASQSRTATPDTGAHYQLASEDGSHVFFTANYGLTPVSSVGANSAAKDLYSYNVDTEALTNISADANQADANGAGVRGVLGTSADGSYVYFAARGQLVPGFGGTESQNNSANTYNVYLFHAGALSFVGLLTNDDTTNLNSNATTRRPHSYTSKVSPDGRYLLFVSKANVTGYSSGGTYQAYRYSAGENATVCVSCPTDGLPSIASPNDSPLSSKGFLLSYEYVSRAMNADGSRVVFASTDLLTPGAESGKNIYEWENGRLRLIMTGNTERGQDTRYGDISASGDDIYFTTPERLVSQDFDFTRDLYDAKVNGGFPEPPPPPIPCDPLAEGCQGPPAPQPGPTSPASEGFSGSGNPAPVAHKPKKHHKRKKRHGAKRKRHDNRTANSNRRAAR
jgi:hypothetical protein